MVDGWLSYDSVADTYERVAVPWFTPLAEALVESVRPVRGERILDLGTGTGLAARTAHRAVPGLALVGVDPSTGMLATAVDRRVLPVAGLAPGLPFRAGSFDAAMANLALSHVRDLAAGVTDLARTLRNGGRFGCTAWADQVDDGPDAPRGVANRILEELRSELGLDLVPPDRVAPSEDLLKEPAHLRAVLEEGGLSEVEVRPVQWAWSFTVAEFLSGWGGDARYRRAAVGEPRWREYVDAATSALTERLGDHIDIANVAWVATGSVHATAPR